MGNISKFSRSCELSANFDAVLLPLFDAQAAVRGPTAQRPAASDAINNIGRLGLNIYSPAEQVPSYENVLCREIARRENDYGAHQSVSSFWFSGHPLKQLSPEAITELCFRFSNHFSRGTAPKAVRGICATTSELDKPTLALLAGLQFNCIELTLDASIAGNDRSLDKLKALAEQTADYSQIKLKFRIRIGDHTHPDFLSRLLVHVTNTSSQQVELVCSGTSTRPRQEGLNSTRELLRRTLRFFKSHDWCSCGNNYFFSKEHVLSALREQRKLMFTPWGYQSWDTQTLLGLGVNAVSMIDGEYQRNCANPHTYNRCISENTAIPITRYKVGHQDTDLYQNLQNLLCYHLAPKPEQDTNWAFARLINKGWLTNQGTNLSLSEEGLVNLNPLCKSLYSRKTNNSYNAALMPDH